MTLRRRGYLVEAGKSVDIDFNADDIRGLKLSAREKNRAKTGRKIDTENAVKKVLTWTDDGVDWVSKHSTIRMLVGLYPGDTKRREYLFSIYDRSSGEKPTVITANVRYLPGQDTVQIGEFKSFRAAKKAATEWLIKEATLRFARRIERISTRQIKRGKR